TGVPVARMRRMTSTPSIPGITRSVSNTSAAVSATASTAASPSPASATTSKPWASRKDRSPWRTTGWSSDTTTRIGPPSSRCAPGAGRLVHGGEPQPPGPRAPGVGVEAPPVVADGQHDPLVGTPVVGAEPEDHPVGRGVAEGVGDRLLGDAQHLVLDVRVELGQLGD